MADPSRGVEFRQAVDVLLREQRAFEDERAQWEYERVELLNKYARVILFVCIPLAVPPSLPFIRPSQLLQSDEKPEFD